MLGNRYGEFEADGRAFVIRDRMTPMPWVNVISNGRYGVVVSQNGGGFSWFDDAQHCVLTRWEMDLARDDRGKYLYLSDLDSGQVWSAAPAPCMAEYSRYSCRHALGSTTFDTSHAGIAVEWTISVSPEDPVEVWHVRVTNESGRSRRVRVASYLEWCCGVAPDAKREFHRLFIRTRCLAGRVGIGSVYRAVLAEKTMWDIPPRSERDHWNRPWPYVAAHAVVCDRFVRELSAGDKGVFCGRYTRADRPVAMVAQEPPSGAQGGFGRHGDACAALGGDLELSTGETVELHYLLAIAEAGPAEDDPTGSGEVERAVIGLVERYADRAVATGTAARAAAMWDRLLSPLRVQTGREDFDTMVNVWLGYQAISGRLWGRTGYYQQSGAFGFRDQLQDSQVWLLLDPPRARQQILRHATRQFTDGSVNHWWHELADFGNRTSCSDDYLWLAYITASYLRETDDFGILQQVVPFRDGAETGQDAATLLEHCRRSVHRAFSRMSPRGLPLIGSCDWNDGLSALGVGGRGESVWLGMFLATILKDWGVILRRLGDRATAEEWSARRDALIRAINQHAWDGEYYRYGTKDNGEWIGAGTCREGRIHLNAQTWSVLSECGIEGRGERAWESAKRALLQAYGPLLLAPAYTRPDADIGYITRYAPGSRENGGVYMHAATWALMTACALRDRAAVGAIWDGICPAWRGRRAEEYFAEPYVTPGNVDGPLSPTPGRAGWTWYTGSAAWLHRVAVEWIIGARAEWGGLRIDPVPPAALGRVTAVRTWRGRRIRVRFDASQWSAGGVPHLVLNGRVLTDCLITESDVPAGQEAEVEVRWAAAGAGLGAVVDGVGEGVGADRAVGSSLAGARVSAAALERRAP
jgi:cellobiose phosphorylase